jgi:hypothetical protein
MTDDGQAAMQESMEFTLQLADKILLSTKGDPMDAFINAVGTLAQVIHIITPDGTREDTIKSMTNILRTYLEVLDTLRGPSSPLISKP